MDDFGRIKASWMSQCRLSFPPCFHLTVRRRSLIIIIIMLIKFTLIASVLFVAVFGLPSSKSEREDLPTTYEHFTAGGVTVGLEATKEGFKVNGKPLKIVSGAMHYFRIHPDLWRDRLRKLRAIGANTVETYTAWNLHEPERDSYDFGNGTNDFSEFLDVKRYIQIAQEEDLMVLLRPGPYICSEWEFGGLPSWLQQDPDMKVRQFYQPYLERVEKYFRLLLSQLVELQFTKGGPIIGLQIENEYGSFSPKSKEYIQFLVNLVKNIGFNETLLYTSDGVGNGDGGTLLDQLLYTANFQSNAEGNFDALLKLQPDKPVMAMEYWAGWFDHWFEDHSTTDVDAFGNVLDVIIGPKYNGSVNFYMFHGGTNFGFMAGANTGGEYPGIDTDVTSYDYDAPLSEAGDYTPKYYKAMELIEKYEYPKLARPLLPTQSAKKAYPALKPTRYIPYEDLLQQAPRLYLNDPSAMEDLPINGGSGQSYGYLVHRKKTPTKSGAVLTAGPVKDFAVVLVDGKIQPTSFKNSTGRDKYWINSVRNVTLEGIDDTWHNVDLLIENLARVNFGYAEDFLQRKGLPNGTVTLDGALVQGFEVYPLEFKKSWVNGLTGFQETNDVSQVTAPFLAQATFNVTEEGDTFLDMTGWQKGIVLINGFNLGRYWNVGPQRTLYIPSPLLKRGENTLTVFELLGGGNEIRFLESADLGPAVQMKLKDYLPRTVSA